MRSPGTNRSKQFSRDFIPEDSQTLRRWRKNFASTPPKISELLCNKPIIRGGIEQSLVRLRTDSSRGERDTTHAACPPGFILTSPDGADDPPCRSSLSMRENVTDAKNKSKTCRRKNLRRRRFG